MVRTEIKPGSPGMRGRRDIPGSDLTYINASNEIAQVSTISVGTATAVTYKVTIDGEEASYAAQSGDTAAQIAIALAADINLNGLGVYAQASTNTVILTGNTKGVPFTPILSGGGSGYSVALTTASANSGIIVPGRAIARASSDGERICRRFTDETAQTFLGVALLDHCLPQYPDFLNGTFSSGYRPKDAVVARKQGSIWVEVEGTVTIDSPVYVRKAVNGQLNKINIFAGASGTGLVELSGAKFITGGTGLAELDLTGLEAFVIPN